jgi:hypothetical protein
LDFNGPHKNIDKVILYVKVISLQQITIYLTRNFGKRPTSYLVNLTHKSSWTSWFQFGLGFSHSNFLLGFFLLHTLFDYMYHLITFMFFFIKGVQFFAFDYMFYLIACFIWLHPCCIWLHVLFDCVFHLITSMSILIKCVHFFSY